jgi:o-succinylbenzoate synthase
VRIESVRMRRLQLPMREPFETSFGRELDKDLILVEVTADGGAVGMAECVAMSAPLYSEETTETAWHIIRDFLAQRAVGCELSDATDLMSVGGQFSAFKGHNMAKAALEMAIWDLYSAYHKIPLSSLLGGVKSEIGVGISVGIQPDIPALLRKIEGYLEEGFQRIKVKIKPGWDIEPLTAIRKTFGAIDLMADANSAYRLTDLHHLQRFDAFGLTMIEQPLAHDDIFEHAKLQQQLQTAICLDESIHDVVHAKLAVELGACRVINLKLGRVGGFAQALQIHDVCREAGIDLWCGGMLETGVGRLHNVAVTALPGFTLPGDTAPSARYFEEDIIDPPVSFAKPGILAVEPLTGVAGRVRMDRVDRWTVADWSSQS